MSFKWHSNKCKTTKYLYLIFAEIWPQNYSNICFSKVFVLVNILEYVPPNILVIGGRVFMRRKIPMDTRYDPILADLFLLLLEVDFSG